MYKVKKSEMRIIVPTPIESRKTTHKEVLKARKPDKWLKQEEIVRRWEPPVPECFYF
jgi:hypothetical protein